MGIEQKEIDGVDRAISNPRDGQDNFDIEIEFNLAGCASITSGRAGPGCWPLFIELRIAFEKSIVDTGNLLRKPVSRM